MVGWEGFHLSGAFSIHFVLAERPHQQLLHLLSVGDAVGAVGGGRLGRRCYYARALGQFVHGAEEQLVSVGGAAAEHTRNDAWAGGGKKCAR